MENSQTLMRSAPVVVPAFECGGHCRWIYQYWDSLRRGGRLPSRKDFDPARAPPRILPNLILMEPMREPETSRRRLWLRLVGTALVDTYRREITGRFLDEVYIADDYEDVTKQFDVLFETGRPTCLWSETRTRDGRFMNYERIVLPFAENGRDIDMVLASVEFFPADHRFDASRWRQPPVESRLTVR